jgi:serine/threonine protein phosphatase PrpC
VTADVACPACGYPTASPDDAWCEACGSPLPATRSSAQRSTIEAEGVGGITDVGLVRKHNQDALALDATRRGAFAVVCDGVSSSADGGTAAWEAATAAAASLSADLRSERGWEPEASMGTAVERAVEAVGALGSDPLDPSRSPSCTLVAATWDGDAVTLASIGDSRAYWLAPGSSQQLTTDDSWAQEQVASGAMTARTAMRQAQAHAITRWLGADAPLSPPRVTRFVPPGPGHLLLCSDGLWNHVPEPARLEALLTADPAPPATLAACLADAALAAGGRDNVTVVVMEVQP